MNGIINAARSETGRSGSAEGKRSEEESDDIKKKTLKNRWCAHPDSYFQIHKEYPGDKVAQAFFDRIAPAQSAAETIDETPLVAFGNRIIEIYNADQNKELKKFDEDAKVIAWFMKKNNARANKNLDKYVLKAYFDLPDKVQIDVSDELRKQMGFPLKSEKCPNNFYKGKNYPNNFYTLMDVYLQAGVQETEESPLVAFGNRIIEIYNAEQNEELKKFDEDAKVIAWFSSMKKNNARANKNLNQYVLKAYLDLPDTVKVDISDELREQMVFPNKNKNYPYSLMDIYLQAGVQETAEKLSKSKEHEH